MNNLFHNLILLAYKAKFRFFPPKPKVKPKKVFRLYRSDMNHDEPFSFGVFASNGIELAQSEQYARRGKVDAADLQGAMKGIAALRKAIIDTRHLPLGDIVEDLT